MGWPLRWLWLALRCAALRCAALRDTDWRGGLVCICIRQVTVTTCPLAISGATANGDTYLSFRNPNGNSLAANDDTSPACQTSGMSLASYLTYTVGTTGNYSVRATCISSSSACAGSIVQYQIGSPPSCSYTNCYDCANQFTSSGCGWCASSGTCTRRNPSNSYYPDSGTCYGTNTFASYYGYSCATAQANAGGANVNPTGGTGGGGGGGGGGNGGSSAVGGVTGTAAIGTGVAIGLVAPAVVTGLIYVIIRCCKCGCITGEPNLGGGDDKKAPPPLSPISMGSPTPGSSGAPAPPSPAPPGGAMEMTTKVWTPSANGGGTSSNPATPINSGGQPSMMMNPSAPPAYGSGEGMTGVMPDSQQDVKVDMMGSAGQPVVMMVPAPSVMCDNQCGTAAAIRCDNVRSQPVSVCATLFLLIAERYLL